MDTGLWWNDTDRQKQKYLERAPSQCHFVHHKSHMVSQGLRCDRPAGAMGRPIPFVRVFMPYALTTAHPTLVCGTVVKRTPGFPFILSEPNSTQFQIGLIQNQLSNFLTDVLMLPLGFTEQVKFGSQYWVWQKAAGPNGLLTVCLSVCIEVNLVSCFVHSALGCLRTSCERTGDDAKPVTDPPVSMALPTLQWLECSKKPELNRKRLLWQRNVSVGQCVNNWMHLGEGKSPPDPPRGLFGL